MHERMVAHEVWGDKHRKGRFRHTADMLTLSKYSNLVENPYLALVKSTLNTSILVFPAEACIGPSNHTQWALATRATWGRDKVRRRNRAALSILLDNL